MLELTRATVSGRGLQPAARDSGPGSLCVRVEYSEHTEALEVSRHPVRGCFTDPGARESFKGDVPTSRVAALPPFRLDMLEQHADSLVTLTTTSISIPPPSITTQTIVQTHPPSFITTTTSQLQITTATQVQVQVSSATLTLSFTTTSILPPVTIFSTYTPPAIVQTLSFTTTSVPPAETIIGTVIPPARYVLRHYYPTRLTTKQ